MALEVKQLVRVFKYNSIDLKDPDPASSVEQVRDLYAGTYPEIVNATIEGPEQKDGKLVYMFRRAVGTKGAEDSSVAIPAATNLTVDNKWQSYWADVIPAKASLAQVKECRRAFYAGALAVTAINKKIGDDLSEDAGIAVLQGLDDELKQFVADVSEGKA